MDFPCESALLTETNYFDHRCLSDQVLSEAEGLYISLKSSIVFVNRPTSWIACEVYTTETISIDYWNKWLPIMKYIWVYV